MSLKAVIFPGQGSQFVGMGREAFEADAQVRGLFERANATLGIDLTGIMFEGPADRLTQTEFTQPAIYLHSVALFHVSGLKPDMVAGHSLGEFSALAAAGVLSFEDGLKLVRLRGQHMQQAGVEQPGAMAAVIGMDDEAVEGICAQSSAQIGKPVVPANYNCPGQLVISGDVDAVEHAMAALKAAGCRLVKRLAVSGAFHSPLMGSAHEPLAKALEATEFSTPTCPVYANYTGQASTDPAEIKENALNQLLNPVRWTQTLQNMSAAGATHFVEVGPGKVLQGLVQRTVQGATVEGIQ